MLHASELRCSNEGAGTPRGTTRGSNRRSPDRRDGRATGSAPFPPQGREDVLVVPPRSATRGSSGRSQAKRATGSTPLRTTLFRPWRWHAQGRHAWKQPAVTRKAGASGARASIAAFGRVGRDSGARARWNRYLQAKPRPRVPRGGRPAGNRVTGAAPLRTTPGGSSSTTWR